MTGDEPGPRQAAARRPHPDGARVTPRQVAHWRRSGLVRDAGRDLADLRVIVALRRAGVSLGRIRAAFDRAALDRTSSDRSAYSYAVHASELYLRHPDGTWESDRRPGQLVLDGTVPLRPLDGAVVRDSGATPPGDSSTPPHTPARTPARTPAQTRTAATARRARPAAPDSLQAIRGFLAREDAARQAGTGAGAGRARTESLPDPYTDPSGR
jgi:DNA-binding transcriptional MerR regulator